MQVDEKASTGGTSEAASVLTQTYESTGGSSGTAAPPATGRFGRFVLSRFLGEGASGRVYAAHDTVLDRTVAIKLLRVGVSRTHLVQERLLGEAWALARLSHPNVVQIYDLGVLHGKVYLALEYIDGVTLRAWQGRHAGDWRAIVAMYCQCGEGLAAAHEVGLVHRDFKPENVMISKDGRPHVLDFGLAGLVETTSDAEGHDEGRFVGTPAYMSPEQFLREPVDARSDQYSFCVALYEALHSVRPFQAETVAHQQERVLAGEPLPETPRSAAPSRLTALLRRGLAVDPGQRWPDMRALLAELHGLLRPSRRPGALALVAAAAGAAAVSGALWTYGPPAPSPCSGGAAEMAALWNVERQAGLQRRFLRASEPDPARRWWAVRADLGARASRWATLHRDTCEAHRRLERTDAQYEGQLACLHVHKVAFAALLEGLEHGPAADLERAQQALLGLPDVERCAAVRDDKDDPARLLADNKPTALRDEVTRALMLRTFQSALTRPYVDDLVARARASGDRRALIGALTVGALTFADGPASEERLVEALTLAEASGDDETLSNHGPDLVHILGIRNNKPREALVWARLLEARLERVGGSARQRFRLLSELSAVYQRQNDFQTAVALLGRARAVLDHAPDADGGAVSLGRRMVMLQRRLGALDAAEVTLAEVEALLAASPMMDPQEVEITHQVRGTLSLALGRPEEAYAEFVRVLDLWSRRHGAGSAQVGVALGSIADALRELGRLDAAYHHSQRATEIYRRTNGPQSRIFAKGLARQGNLALLLGQLPVAERALADALAILQQTYEGDNLDMVEPWCNLAEIALHRGEVAEAERLARKAVATIEGTLGADHPEMAGPLRLLAESALHRGDAAQAAAHAQLAVTAARRGGIGVIAAGRASLARARARAALAGIDAQVVADAADAEALFVRYGDSLAPLREAAAALMAPRPAPADRRRSARANG